MPMATNKYKHVNGGDMHRAFSNSTRQDKDKCTERNNVPTSLKETTSLRPSTSLTMRESGNNGLWLLQGDKAQRVIIGNIHGTSVSPDGCRVVFTHAKNVEEYLSTKKPYRTIKIINFCEGGEKQ